MKYPIWIFLLLSTQVMAQPLTLDKCYQLSAQNYPLIKQLSLISKSGAYSVENAAKGYLPQLTFSGQATYQSDVVHFPLPGLPELSKDQYKVQAEITQTIYDGGTIKYQKELEKANTATQQQQLDVNMYAVRERVSQLFFGILLTNEQLQQNDLRKTDIESGIHKMQGAVDNGTALRSSLDELKAELLNTEQLRTQLVTTRKGYMQMLALFINQPVTELVKPSAIPVAVEIKRPELQLYNQQKQTFGIREKQLRVNYLPKITAFAQGGYGRPTFNIIDNSFGFYGIGGIRFSWALNSLYTLRNNRQLLRINRQEVDVQQETFLFNTRLTLTRQQIDAQQYDDMITQDRQIINLRTSVKNAAVAQLENGVITSHDYISQVNAENLARQNLALHEIQLLQVQYNSKNTSGN
ncbi:Outer membrane protein TolC [Chitinophaga sp. CF118]|uniref:TolC family protein n=1 Tax=Chitinophaga sp. CF118 TaxID=1884367 RepID=UPI0008EFD22B|nr:TolC family protein [Chitinophaga sp. CF118]SFF03216.1 Outer membrane protein TolC [Chitinophaga sp. CF118]